MPSTSNLAVAQTDLTGDSIRDQPAPNPRLSFVIPVLDEEDSLRTLCDRIAAVCDEQRLSYQIIFIDDGSRDQSWQVMQELASGSTTIAAIKLRRNFGKAAALSAGFDAAVGEIVITMDADLQDDPKEIPRFLEKLAAGCDVVSGWKRVRHDPWHKVLPSRVFNWMVSKLTGVALHDHNCGFKAYRREIFDEVKLYGELHRFVPVLASSKGWRVGEIEVEHHAREFGRSKYGVTRIFKGFLDLVTIYFLTGFTNRPFHLIGAAGLGCFALGGLGIVYLSAMWVISRLSTSMEAVNLHATAIFYYCILAVLLGAQFFLAGLLAELMISLSRERKDPYSVSARVGAMSARRSDSDYANEPIDAQRPAAGNGYEKMDEQDLNDA